MKALLLSGGIDSAALASWVGPDLAYTIDYGQLAAGAEVRASRLVCAKLEIPHKVLRINCKLVGSGDLCGKASAAIAPSTDWWPFRNQLLLTVAGMAGVCDSVSELLIGSVTTDKMNSDGCVEFVRRISAVMSHQLGGISVAAPAVGLSSVQLIRISALAPDLLASTHSCHTGNMHCGLCRGCQKRITVLDDVEGWP